MKNREVVDRILGYHPHLPNYRGCDSWKAGDPEAECTGVVTALTPTVDVIRKTAALGANLLVVHEPTYYTSADEAGWFESFPNSVFEEKKRLLDEAGIAVWRDHDHMHAHQPDGIFTGVVKYLGWSDTLVTQRSESMYSHFHVRFPEMTVEELCQHFIRTLNLNGMRYIGDPAAKVSTLAFVGHLFPTPPRPGSDGSRQVEYGASIIRTLEEQADVIVPGEIIEWTVLSYVRDAVELGKAKAVLNPGHFNWEELGMKYAQEWISALVDGAVPVTYVPSGDLYRFALPRK